MPARRDETQSHLAIPSNTLRANLRRPATAAKAVGPGGTSGGRAGAGAVEPAPSQGATEAVGPTRVGVAEPREALDRAGNARKEPSRGEARGGHQRGPRGGGVDLGREPSRGGVDGGSEPGGTGVERRSGGRW